MNRIAAPWQLARSEAFAEDLFDDVDSAPPTADRPLHSLLLCAVPVVLALLGGVAAFFHTAA